MGNWLMADEEERDDTIRHELCHVVLHPMTTWVNDMVARFVDDADLADWLLEEWRQRLEGATTDLELLFKGEREGGEQCSTGSVRRSCA